VEVAVRTLLGRASIGELALVSALAGAGEELLFRGVLQPVISHWLSPIGGLLVASLLFGLAHSLSVVYFLLATMIGLCFGWMAERWDDVLAPAVSHGLYDFVALVYLLRFRNQKRRPDPGESDRL
jgi:membrane protease YdiL (CAAX protease family)